MTRERFEKVIVEVDSDTWNEADEVVMWHGGDTDLRSYYRKMVAVYHQLMLDRHAAELVEGITEKN